MEWVVGIVVVLLILGVLFGRSNEKPKPQPTKTAPRTPSPARDREYATILENNEHRPVTSGQVAEMFAGIRERLKEHRKAAKAMQKLADKYLETGNLDEAAFAALAQAEGDARRTLTEAEALNDKLYFNSESATERYYKFVDDLSEAELDN